jgi:cytochrome P450
VAAVASGSAASNSRAFAALQVAVTELLQTLDGREQKDDVVNAVLYGTVEGRPLTKNEQVGTIIQLLLGGLRTTVGALGHMVHRMTLDPGLEARLREPDWARDYTDEFLRIDTPVKMIARRATRDVELGEMSIKAGDMVAVMLASANRDEQVFDRPDELCLGRESNPHLSFGLGVHRCIGSNLARLEIEDAMDSLLARATNFRMAPGAVLTRIASNPELGWEKVQVQFDLL